MDNTIGAILFGAKIAKKLIKENPGVQMVLTLENVGDQTFELAYLRSYQKHTDIAK